MDGPRRIIVTSVRGGTRGRPRGLRGRSGARGQGSWPQPSSTLNAGGSPSGAGPNGAGSSGNSVAEALTYEQDMRADSVQTCRTMKRLSEDQQAEMTGKRLEKQCSYVRLPVVSGTSRKRTAEILGSPLPMPLGPGVPMGVPTELPASILPPWMRLKVPRLIFGAPDHKVEVDMARGTPSPEGAEGASQLARGTSPLVYDMGGPSTINIKEENGMDAGSDVDEQEPQVDEDAAEPMPETLDAETISMLTDNLPQETTDILTNIDRTNDAVVRNLLPVGHFVFDWNNDLLAFRGVRETFTGTPGPTFPLSELECPLDAFLKFWDVDIIDKIVTETNRYAEQFISSGISRHSRVKRWKPTTRAEMYIFLAMQIQQSLNSLTVEKDYFIPPSWVTAMPNFKKVISLDRWVLLKKFLHFSDNSSRPDSLSSHQRKLFKIQPIIDHLSSKFKSLYLPEQNIALDESLLKWLGHLSFIQIMTTKAAGSETKSYEVCESSSGYLWSFSIYAGKDTELTADDPNVQQTDTQTDKSDGKIAPFEQSIDTQGATAKIVFDLASPLFHKGHTIVMDNFYNSPLLARCLKLNGMDCYGTLRLNRDSVPGSLKSLNKTSLNTGEILASTSGDINVMAWKDTGLVSMLSTYHKMEVGCSEKYGTWRYKPQVVLDYNATMGGVDKKDQLLAGFPLERKRNSIWYKKLFRRLLNVSVMNAYIIYKHKDERITHRNFRRLLADGILNRFFTHVPEPNIGQSIRLVRQLPGGPKDPPRPVLENNHYSVKFEKNEPKMRNCTWCKQLSKRIRTSRKCNVCKVPLCVDCMMPYHDGTRPPR